MFKSTAFYLQKLIADGHKWQYLDINGQGKKPKLYFNSPQVVFFLVSIITLFLIKSGFNKDFIGYAIASLSVFIGLFLTLILSVFDKFRSLNLLSPRDTERDKVIYIQTKNFFKQFTALTSYAILLALFSILLLSISLLLPSMNIDIFNYKFLLSSEYHHIKNFFFISLLIIYRVTIIYFYLDFLLVVLYALTSMYTYISNNYEKS